MNNKQEPLTSSPPTKRSGTAASEPNSTGLWRKHFDEGFFRGAAEGTAAPSQQSNPKPTFVPPEQKVERGLPENVTSKLMPHDPVVASFRPLQEWDGYVVKVDAESFVAHLTDLTAKGRPDSEEVEIPLEDLDEETQSQLIPGRLFRWSIGYERFRFGQKTRISRITVRRLPSWTRQDVAKADEQAKTLVNKLKWE